MTKLNSCWNYAVSKLNLIHSDNDIDSLLVQLVASNDPVVLGFLNAHGFNTLLDIPSFFDSIKCMDVVLRDGIGLEILLRMQGKEAGKNMNGTDFIPALLERYRGKRIAILATKDPYLSETKCILEKNLTVDVIVAEDGFHPDEYYLKKLSGNPVDIILLGMGMPKQERVACKLKRELDYPVLIVCGGAIIDFLSGRFRRAPAWVRKIGMEWFYRFIHEPRRLFKRYISGNVIFILRVLYHIIMSPKR